LTQGYLYEDLQEDLLKKGDVWCSWHTHIPVGGGGNGFVRFNSWSESIEYNGNSGLYENGCLSVVELDRNEIIGLTL